MSFVTASHHCITELEFVGADDIRNEVTFRSASHSQPGGFHTTILNVLTGDVQCSCFGAKHGECWHCTLAMAKFHSLPAYQLVSQYTSDQLLRAGTKAANMLRVTRRRTWRVLPSDQLALICARAEWQRRRRAELAEATTMAVVA